MEICQLCGYGYVGDYGYHRKNDCIAARKDRELGQQVRDLDVPPALMAGAIAWGLTYYKTRESETAWVVATVVALIAMTKVGLLAIKLLCLAALAWLIYYSLPILLG